jgi:hypothetical protein
MFLIENVTLSDLHCRDCPASPPRLAERRHRPQHWPRHPHLLHLGLSHLLALGCSHRLLLPGRPHPGTFISIGLALLVPAADR